MSNEDKQGDEDVDAMVEFDQTNNEVSGLKGDDGGEEQTGPTDNSILGGLIERIDSRQEERADDEVNSDEGGATSYSEEGRP